MKKLQGHGLLFIFSFLMFIGWAQAEEKEGPPSAIKTSSGWDAYGEIQKGKKRFFEGKADHPNQDTDRREKLSSGQKPPAIILSCSDSRVPPELIFDQGLGEIFTIRSAGHIASTEAIASIEYAIEHLGSSLLIIMGHESCGAVKAAVTTPVGVSTHSPHIDKLLAIVRGHIDIANLKISADDPNLRRQVKDHVSATAADIIQRSALIRESVRREKVVVAEAIYSLKTGKVEFWGVGHRFFSEPAAGRAWSAPGKIIRTHKAAPAAAHAPHGPAPASHGHTPELYGHGHAEEHKEHHGH